jgi:ribA/ribD-fused uncharacterized protein
MSGLFAEEDTDAQYLSRADIEEPLGTHIPSPFFLDHADWPTVEHYFQAMKFEDPAYRERIRLAPTPQKARKLGRTRLKRVRSDWRQVRTTVMTRGIYIRCKTHSSLAKVLLDTNDLRLVENSSYDYFWGCGRDRRGNNHYGKVLMQVRAKLREEAGQEPSVE